MRSTLGVIFRHLEKLEVFVIVYLMIGMTGIAFANMIARRLFSASFVWALELTLNLFLYLIIFGMSYVLRKGLHLGIDNLVTLMPRKPQRILAIIVAAICTLYALAIAMTGLTIADKFFSNVALRGIGSDELDIPHWFTYGVVGLGFGYFAINCLYMMWEIAMGRVESLTASHEAEDTSITGEAGIATTGEAGIATTGEAGIAKAGDPS